MRISGLARRYAGALAEIATQKNNLEKVTAELETVSELFQKSDSLKHVLKSPSFKIEERLSIVKQLSDKLQLSTDTFNFLKVVIENDRFALLPMMAQAVRIECDRRTGMLRIMVSSASPLQLSTLKKLEQAFGKVLAKKIEVTQKVEPELIGGIMAKIGNIVIDGSLKGKLDALRKELRAF